LVAPLALAALALAALAALVSKTKALAKRMLLRKAASLIR
jgi:hypothetical protein